MILSTIVGMVLGVIIIVFSIMISGDIVAYYDPASVLIVVGGVICAIMVTYSFEELKAALPKMKDAFIKVKIDWQADVDKIIQIANVARREGLLALDGSDFGDPFLKKGMELVIDGVDQELVKVILDADIGQKEEQDKMTVKILLSASSYSPAFGMVGTLIGLINMLMTLSDSASLGPNMSVALITTLYGVLLANMIFTPMANKIKTATSLRMTHQAMLMEGVLSIQNGENPKIIKDKLETFFLVSKTVKVAQAETNSKGVSNEKETSAG